MPNSLDIRTFCAFEACGIADRYPYAQRRLEMGSKQLLLIRAVHCMRALAQETLA